MIKTVTIPEKQNQWTCYRDVAYTVVGLVKLSLQGCLCISCGAWSIQGRQAAREITSRLMSKNVSWNPITMNWNLHPCFWSWFQRYPAKALCHRAKYPALAQEEPEEGREIADPGATLHLRGQSADQRQCVWATKQHCSISILQTSQESFVLLWNVQWRGFRKCDSI